MTALWGSLGQRAGHGAEPDSRAGAAKGRPAPRVGGVAGEGPPQTAADSQAEGRRGARGALLVLRAGAGAEPEQGKGSHGSTG